MSRPNAYIQRDPGNVIRSTDWNELQIQTREEIHTHRHTGSDGLKIPREGIEPGAVDGSLIHPESSVQFKDLNLSGSLKVNDTDIHESISNIEEGLNAVTKNLHTGSLKVSGNIDATGEDRRLFLGGNTGTTFGLAYDEAHANHGIFYTEGTPDHVSISPNGDHKNGVVNIYGDGRTSLQKGIACHNGQVVRDFLTWSSVKEGNIPIHIKTNIKRQGDIMYRLLVEGYNYGTVAAINSDVVGYTWSGTTEIHNGQTNNYSRGIGISQYMSSDGYVVVKLSANSHYYIGFSISVWLTNPAGLGFGISAEVTQQNGNL
ncbi:hypothetical protein ACFL2V_00010 [Pseudomonadota bacterium]